MASLEAQLSEKESRERQLSAELKKKAEVARQLLGEKDRELDAMRTKLKAAVDAAAVVTATSNSTTEVSVPAPATAKPAEDSFSSPSKAGAVSKPKPLQRLPSESTIFADEEVRCLHLLLHKLDGAFLILSFVLF